LCAGCIDSGVGLEQFNKLFSAMNLPIIHANTMKLAENRIGKCLVSVAKESCKQALADERDLTLSAQRFVYSAYYFLLVLEFVTVSDIMNL
jgi:ABC-type polysaccharide transport system permease subunit